MGQDFVPNLQRQGDKKRILCYFAGEEWNLMNHHIACNMHALRYMGENTHGLLFPSSMEW
jgi:hypothetical protein